MSASRRVPGPAAIPGRAGVGGRTRVTHAFGTSGLPPIPPPPAPAAPPASGGATAVIGPAPELPTVGITNPAGPTVPTPEVIATEPIGDAAPPTGNGERKARRRGGWGWNASGCLLPLLLIFAVVAGLAALSSIHPGHHSNSGQSSTASASSPAHAAPAKPGTPGYHLPPPAGTVPRVRPLAAVTIVDSNLDLATRRGVITEAGHRWRTYVAQHSLVADRAIVDPVPVAAAVRPFRFSGPESRFIDQGFDALATAHQPLDPAAAVAAAQRSLGSVPDHDRAVIVLTADPVRWLLWLRATPPSKVNVADWSREARTLTYVVDVSAGSGRYPVLAPWTSAAPRTMVADPAKPGAVTEAMARAWVDAVRSGWTGPDNNR